MTTPASRIDWARLRFAIVGALLAAPPAPGDLGPALDRLAAQRWRHPTTGEPLRVARSTLERWYYAARHARQDPVEALRHRVRKDAGTQPSLGLTLREALRAQWQAHPGWTVQLHVDNLKAVVAAHPALGPLPSVPHDPPLLPRPGAVPHPPPGDPAHRGELTRRAAARDGRGPLLRDRARERPVACRLSPGEPEGVDRPGDVGPRLPARRARRPLPARRPPPVGPSRRPPRPSSTASRKPSRSGSCPGRS